MILWLGLALFAVSSVAAIAVPYALTTHRIDINESDAPGSGQHVFAQLNYMNPANYDAVGRQRLIWLYGVTVTQLVGAVLVAIGWVG